MRASELPTGGVRIHGSVTRLFLSLIGAAAVAAVGLSSLWEFVLQDYFQAPPELNGDGAHWGFVIAAGLIAAGAATLVVGYLALFRAVTWPRANTRPAVSVSAAAAERQSRSVMERGLTAVFITDDMGIIVEADAAMERVLGWPADELIGQRIEMLMTEACAAGHRQFVEDYKKYGQSNFVGKRREVAARHRDGREIPIAIAVSEWWDGEARKFTGVVRDISERQSLDRIAREQSEQWRLVSDNLPVFVSYIDTDHRYLFLNGAYEKMFGRPTSELVGRHCAEIMGREVYEARRHLFDRALAGERVEFQSSMEFPEMGLRDLRMNYYPDIGEDGVTNGFYALIVDITETTKTQRALEESERQLHLITDAVPVLIGYVDTEMRYQFANEAYRAWTGYSPDQLKGMKIEDAVGVTAFETVRPYMERALAGQHAIFSLAVTYDEFGERYIEGHNIPDFGENGEVRGVFVFVQDVTERKRTEVALKTSEAHLRLITDTMPALIAHIDKDLHYLFANRTYEEWTGIQRGELVGRHVEDVLGRPVYLRHREMMMKALTGEPVSFEATGDFQHAGRRHVAAEYIPDIGPDGEVRGFFVMGVDMTERKENELALERAKEDAEQANRAKSRFLAAANHDLRQPLHALGMQLDLLEEAPPEAIPAAGQTMRDNLAVMSSVLNALLDIGNLEADQVPCSIETFPVFRILDNMKKHHGLQAERKGLLLEVPPVDHHVRSDPALLERIIDNFVSNAIRYTETGKVAIACEDNGSFLSIEVRDTGIGIAVEEQATIFEEYYQLDNPERDRSRGLGMGLAIVHRIARLLGHEIYVNSAKGRGSTFGIHIPLAEEDAAEASAKSALDEREIDLTGIVIVVVDDDPIVLSATALLLESRGAEVLSAASGSEALSQIAGEGPLPGLFLIDYRLPGNEDGISVARALKDKIGADVPALIITGDTDPAVTNRVAKAGHLIFNKPVEPDKLIATIHAQVQRSSAGE